MFVYLFICFFLGFLWLLGFSGWYDDGVNIVKDWIDVVW